MVPPQGSRRGRIVSTGDPGGGGNAPRAPHNQSEDRGLLGARQASELRPRTVEWAAKWLGVSADRVRRAIDRGELAYVDLSNDPADLQGRQKHVTLMALSDYVRQRSRKMSRPKGAKAGGKLQPVQLPPSHFLDREGF